MAGDGLGEGAIAKGATSCATGVGDSARFGIIFDGILETGAPFPGTQGGVFEGTTATGSAFGGSDATAGGFTDSSSGIVHSDGSFAFGIIFGGSLADGDTGVAPSRVGVPGLTRPFPGIRGGVFDGTRGNISTGFAGSTFTFPFSGVFDATVSKASAKAFKSDFKSSVFAAKGGASAEAVQT